MERIISLLSEKIHYLEKFYSITENEVKNLSAGNIENVQSFYETRDKLLDIIRYIDDQIEKSPLTEGQIQATTAVEKTKIRDLLRMKDQYISQIVKQDLMIIELIEDAKSVIISELQGVKKARKAVSGYKQPLFNNKVNEKI